MKMTELSRLQHRLADLLDSMPLESLDETQLRVVVAVFESFGAGNDKAEVVPLIGGAKRRIAP
jgi:hypothetical protein